MDIAQVIDLNGEQAIKLPRAFRVSRDVVAIRKQGEAIVLEPLRPSAWPDGFFEEIHIEDPAFCRPPQGQMPAVCPTP